MATCPCPKHPFGCYGHPHKCGCAETEQSTITALQARIEALEAENTANAWKSEKYDAVVQALSVADAQPCSVGVTRTWLFS